MDLKKSRYQKINKLGFPMLKKKNKNINIFTQAPSVLFLHGALTQAKSLLHFRKF